jgi:hypothetical protein
MDGAVHRKSDKEMKILLYHTAMTKNLNRRSVQFKVPRFDDFTAVTMKHAVFWDAANVDLV